MVQILVRVKDKETDSEREITYKAYRDLITRYELIGQIDEAGNLIEGNPNLLPQHQIQAVKKDAVHAGEGVKVTEVVEQIPKEAEKPKEEDVPHETEVKERRKPGPKPKNA